MRSRRFARFVAVVCSPGRGDPARPLPEGVHLSDARWCPSVISARPRATAVVRHGRRPPGSARPPARPQRPARVVPHGGRSRVSVVSPRRSRSSRPHPVRFRPPPAAPVAPRVSSRRARRGPPDGDLFRARSGARGRPARDPGAAPRRSARFRCRCRCRCPPLPAPAAADPAPARGRAAPPPRRRPRRRHRRTPRAPRRSCEQVQHEAEALTEQWHAAQDDVTARRAELAALRAAIDPARAAADAARGDEEQLPPAGRHRRAVDVRERPARRVQRAAGQRDAAGLPGPDVGAGDDRRRTTPRRWTS